MPKYRCGIKECESVPSATYYETDITPYTKWGNEDLVYSDWVELAIGQISPNKSINNIGCKRISKDFSMPSAALSQQSSSTQDGQCSQLTAEIKHNLTKG